MEIYNSTFNTLETKNCSLHLVLLTYYTIINYLNAIELRNKSTKELKMKLIHCLQLKYYGSIADFHILASFLYSCFRMFNFAPSNTQRRKYGESSKDILTILHSTLTISSSSIQIDKISSKLINNKLLKTQNNKSHSFKKPNQIFFMLGQWRQWRE